MDGVADRQQMRSFPLRSTRARLALGVLALSVLAGAGLAVHGLERWRAVQSTLDERLAAWLPALPARVYARPLVLSPGDRPERLQLAAHLERVGYRRGDAPPGAPGEFRQGDAVFSMWLRDFDGPDGRTPGGAVELLLDPRGRIREIRGAGGKRLTHVSVEPPLIGLLGPGELQDREPVPLQELPPHVVHAFLAIEDLRFFDHAGVDPHRVLGAAWANLRSGGIAQGGSTITQQWVKNALLSPERTFSRKLDEAALALALEKRRSKEEILGAYLDEIYLGQRGAVAVHGVGAGARHHFGKDVRSLDLAEAALLAALARGPSRYSPERNPQSALERRNLVLARMADEGLIGAVERDAAAGQPLGLRSDFSETRSFEYVLDTLRGEIRGQEEPERLERDAVRLHTSIDWRLQRLAETALRDGLAELEAGASHLLRREPPLEAALVALEPRSGEVLALVGGRDFGASQFNRATEARRQPGSVFKPVVALAALTGPQPRFTLASVLPDEPLIVPAPEPLPGEEQEPDWEPRNHDEEFRGEVTLRTAIEDSLNIPTVRLAQEVGLREVVKTARALGVTSRLRPVPSIALGTFEVSLLEMTRAYATLASGGIRVSPHLLRTARSREAELLATSTARGQRAFAEADVFLVTSLLEGVVRRGTGRSVRNRGYRGPLAGKTGSSDDYRDGWFIGYTPEIVVGVWVGFDDGAKTGLPGAFTALPIFTRFLSGAIGASGGRGFVPPRGVHAVEVVAHRDHPAGLRCEGEPEWFRDGTAPSRGCGFLGLPAVGAGPGGGFWPWQRGPD